MDDVKNTLEIALKKGAKTLGKVTEKIIEGAVIFTFVYFQDPEDNIVEIQSWNK